MAEERGLLSVRLQEVDSEQEPMPSPKESRSRFLLKVWFVFDSAARSLFGFQPATPGILRFHQTSSSAIRLSNNSADRRSLKFVQICRGGITRHREITRLFGMYTWKQWVDIQARRPASAESK